MVGGVTVTHLLSPPAPSLPVTFWNLESFRRGEPFPVPGDGPMGGYNAAPPVPLGGHR